HCNPPPAPAEQAPVAVPQAPGTPTTVTAVPVPVPDTQILGGPPGRTTAASAVFRFGALGARAKGFECSVDDGPFTACSSPNDLQGFGPGDHTFAVRALSPNDVPDTTPASYRWTVYA